jgi:ribosomal protein L15
MGGGGEKIMGGGHYLFKGQFTLHNFCPKHGFHMVVTVVKIESQTFSTAEIQLPEIGK